MRHRTRSTQRNVLSTPESNTRQFVALALAGILAVLLIPVGVQAAQTVNAFITDPGGVNQAAVDTDGNLSVSGDVTVDSTTPVGVTSADDPGRIAFQRTFGGFISPGAFAVQEGFNVPEGQRLVITHVSGDARLPTGQTLTDVSLQVLAGGVTVHHFVPAFNGTRVAGDEFSFSQDAMIYADGFSSFVFVRSATTDSADVSLSISGYLIDCSAAPCN